MQCLPHSTVQGEVAQPSLRGMESISCETVQRTCHAGNQLLHRLCREVVDQACSTEGFSNG